MAQVETFEHTADLGLRVRAVEISDLFRAAAEGLFGIIVANTESIRPEQVERLALSADELEDLLFAWLNELLFLCETRHRLYRDFEVVIQPEGKGLAATFASEPIDRDRHLLDHEVKAVTRHGFSLERDGTEWLAEMILDI